MCEWGTSVEVPLTVPADRSHTGREFVKAEKIDACIAPIVAALNAGGVATTVSCCGHGRTAGEIGLADGRVIRLVASASNRSRRAEEDGDVIGP